MAEPPLLAAAVQDRSTDPLCAVPVTPVGAPGATTGPPVTVNVLVAGSCALSVVDSLFAASCSETLSTFQTPFSVLTGSCTCRSQCPLFGEPLVSDPKNSDRRVPVGET